MAGLRLGVRKVAELSLFLESLGTAGALGPVGTELLPLRLREALVQATNVSVDAIQPKLPDNAVGRALLLFNV